jgi:hypothetical protein
VSIKSNQVRVPDRKPAPKPPSRRTFVPGRVLVVSGVVVFVVAALTVVLWPRGDRSTSAAPRVASAAPEKPIRQGRSDPVPQEKAARSVPTAVDPTPSAAPQPERPAVAVAPPPAQDRADQQVRGEENAVSSPPVVPDPATPPAAQAAAPGRPTVAASRGTGSFGTCVDFVNNPVQASQKALQEQKLLFTVHISGNFEDSHFT